MFRQAEGPALSSMKDHTYEMVEAVNRGTRDDGFEISDEKLRKNRKLPDQLRDNNRNLPNLHIAGCKNEQKDKLLFELVVRHCAGTTKKLVFSNMNFNIPAEKLQVFPMLSEVTFRLCSVENESILRFNDWCPNMINLTFERMKMSTDVYNKFLIQHTCPKVNSLVINFKDSVGMTREFLNALHQRFPSLENLEIILDPHDNYSAKESKFNVPYKALHFKELKKLYVRAFSMDIEKLFDYMGIFNDKIEEFSFAGMATYASITDWIVRCEKLTKLTIDVQEIIESELEKVKDMPLLNHVKISVKKMFWEPVDAVHFARGLPNLSVLDVDSDYNNTAIKYGKPFKDAASNLIKERGKLLIKFFNHELQRTTTISENGFTDDRKPKGQPSTGEPFNLDALLQFINERSRSSSIPK